MWTADRYWFCSNTEVNIILILSSMDVNRGKFHLNVNLNSVKQIIHTTYYNIIITYYNIKWSKPNIKVVITTSKTIKVLDNTKQINKLKPEEVLYYIARNKCHKYKSERP